MLANLDDRLAAALATLTGRSKSFYATQAVIEHADDMEDTHLSSAVRVRVRTGAEVRTPLSDLLVEYGLRSYN